MARKLKDEDKRRNLKGFPKIQRRMNIRGLGEHFLGRGVRSKLLGGGSFIIIDPILVIRDFG